MFVIGVMFSRTMFVGLFSRRFVAMMLVWTFNLTTFNKIFLMTTTPPVPTAPPVLDAPPVTAPPVLAPPVLTAPPLPASVPPAPPEPVAPSGGGPESGCDPVGNPHALSSVQVPLEQSLPVLQSGMQTAAFASKVKHRLPFGQSPLET